MNSNKNILEKIKTFHLPEYNEIPDVGLYLKQVVKYINDSAGDTFSLSVTDSMLSNYVKMHMVPSPVKKQYYRDHIVTLLFISMSKTVISLENIELLLSIQREKYSAARAYEFFKKELEEQLSQVYGLAAAKSPAVKKREASEVTIIRNLISTMAHKFYLEDCLNSLKESQTTDTTAE